MEADRETITAAAAKPGHGSSASLSASTAAPSPTTSESRQRSSSQPSDGPVRKIAEHDSLVTVRLSEPPRGLTLNTNVRPDSTAPSSRSLFANTLSPTPISPSPLSAYSEVNLNDELLSPVTTAHGSKTNLQDELESAQDDDSKTIGPIEEEDSDDEEVDWEQLQKTEDAESNANTSEDVGFILVPGRPGGLAAYVCLANNPLLYSLPPCFLPV